MHWLMLFGIGQAIAADLRQIPFTIIATMVTGLVTSIASLGGIGWMVRSIFKIDKKVGVLCERLNCHMETSPTQPGVTKEIWAAVGPLDTRVTEVEKQCAAEHRRVNRG